MKQVTLALAVLSMLALAASASEPPQAPMWVAAQGNPDARQPGERGPLARPDDLDQWVQFYPVLRDLLRRGRAPWAP